MNTAAENDIRECLRSDRERMLAMARALAREEGSESEHERALRLRQACLARRDAESHALDPVLRYLRPAGEEALEQRCSWHAQCLRLIDAWLRFETVALKRRALAQMIVNMLNQQARDEHRSVMPLLTHRVSDSLREDLARRYLTARRTERVVLTVQTVST